MNKVPASSLTEADMGFVDQAASLFPVSGGLQWAVLSGTDDEISGVINHFHGGIGDAALNPNYHDWISAYRGPLLDIVSVACRAYADKMAHEPMTFMDHLYARRGNNRQVRYTKLYAKYFGS